MSRLHFLNVDPGDCTVIEHNSGRISVIDVCDGNIEKANSNSASVKTLGQLLAQMDSERSSGGNFNMKSCVTNPIDYIRDLGISSIFRFILTHPDMDHMDGLDQLAKNFSILNFWDTGVRKEDPDFSNYSPYLEEDWSRYKKLINSDGTSCSTRLAGDRFQYANKGTDGAGGDGLYILSPDKALVDAGNDGGDVNDASYVILYRSAGGRILIPGDAHDETWDRVIREHTADVQGCSVLIAPHHGRDSDRSFDFLDTIQPKLTLFGNAPSEHLAYDAWNRRDLSYITSNQAGNIILECQNDSVSVYVENEAFAAKHSQYQLQNEDGYHLYDIISARVSEDAA